MKAVITGLRSGLSAPDFATGALHLDVDLEELPKPGEHIILNSGSAYVVESVMWWVQGPENDDYWAKGDYRETAEFEAVHVNVRPADIAGHDLYADGRARGRRDAAADLVSLLKLTEQVDGGALRSVVTEWARREIVTADEAGAVTHAAICRRMGIDTEARS